MNEIRVCGTKTSVFADQVEQLFKIARPKAVGAATAFLSVEGADTFIKLTKRTKITSVKLIAGLSGSITHPQAIRNLHSEGFDLRLGQHGSGIFHPKLLVGGARFNTVGLMTDCNCGYVGSANLTKSGFRKNLEVGLGTRDLDVAAKLGDAFLQIWKLGARYTESNIKAYEEHFARRQKRRSVDDLQLLEITDSETEASKQSGEPLVDVRYANEVWAGLQSFTGEHAFQVEFPKKAGTALRRLFGTNNGRVRIECADGVERNMVFRYYENNGMFRLNVPNDMPKVQWARNSHNGMLVVRKEEYRGRTSFHAEIVRGRAGDEIKARSKALNTLGKTNTREYGWA